MHTPVLSDSALGGLDIKAGGAYIDATAGEGGHIKKMLERGARVLGIDADGNQIKILEEKFKNNESLKLVIGNFSEIEEIAKEQGFFPVDGILFDLGLSYSQLADSGKGFSYKEEKEPLDMRLNKKIEKTAADLINSLNEDELYEIFAKNAEEINSRAIAQAIVGARRLRKLLTVGDLTRLIDKVIGRKDTKIYSRVFQALRMAVNQELENLKKGLIGATKIIGSHGRIAIITFHSVEDRLVKRFIKENKFKEEIKSRGDRTKSYERSATLRIFKK